MIFKKIFQNICYKQPVYNQLGLELQKVKQLLGLKHVTISNFANKIFAYENIATTKPHLCLLYRCHSFFWFHKIRPPISVPGKIHADEYPGEGHGQKNKKFKQQIPDGYQKEEDLSRVKFVQLQHGRAPANRHRVYAAVNQGSSNRRNNIFQEAIEIGVLRTRVASLIT